MRGVGCVGLQGAKAIVVGRLDSVKERVEVGAQTAVAGPLVVVWSWIFVMEGLNSASSEERWWGRRNMRRGFGPVLV